MKNMKNRILIISIILATLFLSVSFVCAEDVGISDNNTTTNQTNNNTINQNNNTTGGGNSTIDNSNTSIKTPKKPSKVSQSSVIAASKKSQSLC
ncbi:hypothetical protein [Methanobrevibacter arboriphilus]|uniref:hypothetical protein n=1 Tax=Methanobrevibacter arboriphilus TaxID=39441 RepID=UPI000AFC3E7B|nr:hypothetical protein [Methanobrevibacter arboriphilus]